MRNQLMRDFAFLLLLVGCGTAAQDSSQMAQAARQVVAALQETVRSAGASWPGPQFPIVRIVPGDSAEQ
jgi:hypothetical protein